MSAFVCNPELFQAVASFATQRRYGSFLVDPRYIKGLSEIADSYIDGANLRRLQNLTADELQTIYANVLYSENIRSVSARYPRDTFDQLPGLIEKPMHIKPSSRHDRKVTPIMILKMLDCLEYQSCETDDYKQTLAYRLLNAIRRAAIRSLSGYDAAPWDFDGTLKTAA